MLGGGGVGVWYLLPHNPTPHPHTPPYGAVRGRKVRVRGWWGCGGVGVWAVGVWGVWGSEVVGGVVLTWTPRWSPVMDMFITRHLLVQP